MYMDRMFTHLRYVRCPTCLRVFCCVKHRVEHERRAHVKVQTTSVVPLPVIRRRFRSAATLEHARSSSITAVSNGRKRLHRVTTPVVDAMLRSPVDSGLRCLEQHHQPQKWPNNDTSVRTVLKARRSSFSSSSSSLSVRLLRPVAESSPAMPAPSPSAASSHAEIATPVGHSVQMADSSVSFYQTPMQTPSVSLAFGSSSQSTSDVTEDGTPTTGRDGGKAKRLVQSSGHDSTQKGFFWSNMARRFRLVLRQAKPKTCDSSSSSPMTNADMVKYYSNIQPRRPIKNDGLTDDPVDPRPSLEVLRQAHEKANKAMSNKSD